MQFRTVISGVVAVLHSAHTLAAGERLDRMEEHRLAASMEFRARIDYPAAGESD